jgi:hypothetical protein
MSCWFQLPVGWRANPSFHKRALHMLMVHLFAVFLTLFYSGYWWLFTIFPQTYQPLLALSLPFIREIFGHMMSSLGKRCAGAEVPSVELIAGNIVALFHALFLSSCLGSIATEISTYILLGIDFVINLLFTGQVYYYRKKGNIKKCGDALMSLVLNEFLEMTMPLTFLLCFLVSFYGGNSVILGMSWLIFFSVDSYVFSGNVGSDYFHFISSDASDIPPFIYSFIILLCIDLISLIFSGIFLKLVLNINLLQVYTWVQKW